MTDVENRLTLLEARVEISELRSKYCWYATRAQPDEMVKLFTEDGVFENLRGAPRAAKGQVALAEYFSRMTPARRVPLVTNEVTHIDGDAANGTCVMQSLGDDAFCGHYVDAFRKIDGRWLFAERRFYPYWPSFSPSAERLHP